eukprot:COSAG01_NODE_1014_length_12131_cov_10.088749_2_plen_30_part_00
MHGSIGYNIPADARQTLAARTPNAVDMTR